VGLAAAAHLIERGERPLIFESGEQVGANVQGWAHVRMFSPWEYVVDAASVRLLQSQGWQMPPRDALPTGSELLEHYLLPLASHPAVAPHLHLGSRVVAVARKSVDKMKDAQRSNIPFVLVVRHADGSETSHEARAVIDASGTWHQPNPLGANGLPALGERQLADRIVYGIPHIDAHKARYANRRVMVVGSGHSAINVILELAHLQESAPQTHVIWAMRGTSLQRVLGGGENDALPARGELGLRARALLEAQRLEVLSPFHILGVQAAPQGTLRISGEGRSGPASVEVDELIVATGARPDLDMLRELRLDLDPALESPRALGPMIDPNIHSCGTVPPHGEEQLRQPEKDFYIAGMKSYGRAPTFLLATGYEQVRSVVAALAGDWEAARDVQLNLPETGVCSTDLVDGGSCCAPAAASRPASATIEILNIPVTGL
jgi:hypothetical protein